MVDQYDPDDLRSHVMMPILEFLSSFEIYLDNIGDLEAILQYIPDDIWPIIDTVAYQSTDRFIDEHGLQQYSQLPSFGNVQGHQLREALAFLLKIAWERGYLMYKFRKYAHIPPPHESADPQAIMDRIVSMGGPNRPDLSTNIEVFLQRAVSISTDPGPIRRSLRGLGDDLASIVEPYLDDWSDAVRTAHGYGILSAKAESQLKEDRLSKIEVTVREGGTIGNVIISERIQDSFNKAHMPITVLKESHKSDIADALRHIADEVAVSEELSEEEKDEVLERLAEIGHQAELPVDKRIRALVRDLLAGTAGVIGAAGGLAGVWSTWGPTISRFFGLG
jgi:hypothetical protein